MKNLCLFAVSLCVSLLTFGQNYNYATTTGTTAPYDYTNTGTTILSIPANEVMSSAQTIPFSFEFYGQTYTQYYLSDNGYITFDNDSISDPNNTSIPDAGGPNNAIYAFWEDLELITGSGSVDEVLYYDYGTTPNRVHVIQWFSPTPVNGTGYLYTAIRLYECGTFDILHNFGNVSGMTATTGAENADGTMGVSVAGSPNLDYPTTGIPGTDDKVYTFYWDGNNYDLALTGVDLSGVVAQGNNVVSGTVSNRGTQMVTSFDLKYTVDGGSPISTSINTNIAPLGGTYSFTHPIPWNVTSTGANHTVCVWTENLNGNIDEVSCNDEVCTYPYTATGTSGVRNAVIEEFTGAWCGFCVDGGVVLDSIIHDNPSGRIIPISIHSRDDMTFDEDVRSSFGISSYPSAMIDRKVFPGESEEPLNRTGWATNAASQLVSYTPVEVSIVHSYDSITRVIDVDVTADFVDYISGDMRIVFNVIEDGVTGTGSGYDQVNLLNTTPGHPFENAGDPIIGYVHNHVLRANPTGAFGNQGTIPGYAGPGDTYMENFQYTLPANFDENNITVVSFVALYSTLTGEREILNGYQVELIPTSPNSVLENDIVKKLNLYPNPASDQAIVDITIANEFQAQIVVFNALGQNVASTMLQNYNSGRHLIDVPVDNLSKGIYYVSVKTNNKTFTRKLILK